MGGFTFQFAKAFNKNGDLVELSFSPEIKNGNGFLFLSKFYLVVESYESNAEDEIKLLGYLFDRVKIQE